MRRIVTERNLVIVLFVMVIIIFSFAERDTKKIEHLYTGVNSPATHSTNELAELKARTITQSSSVIVPLKISE